MRDDRQSGRSGAHLSRPSGKSLLLGSATLGSLALAGAALTRCLRAPILSRAINVTFALLLLASVGLALLL